MAKMFEEIFRESFVIELLWTNKIEYKYNDNIKFPEVKKISFFTIIRKFFSKKFRTIFRK